MSIFWTVGAALGSIIAWMLIIGIGIRLLPYLIVGLVVTAGVIGVIGVGVSIEAPNGIEHQALASVAVPSLPPLSKESRDVFGINRCAPGLFWNYDACIKGH
jgi:hypothetical protein